MRKCLICWSLLLLGAATAPAAETVTAKILAADRGTVTVSAGKESGIAVGQVFTLYTAGKTIRIPLTDTVTYEEGRPAGQAKAVSVSRTTSILEITLLEKGLTPKIGMDAIAKIVPQEPVAAPKPEPEPEPATPEPPRPEPAPSPAPAGGLTLEASATSANPGEDVVVLALGHTSGSSYTWRADAGQLSHLRTAGPSVIWTAPRKAAEVELTAVRHAPGGATSTARLTLSSTGELKPLPAKAAVERIVGPRRFNEMLSANHAVADIIFDDSGYLYFVDSDTKRAYALDTLGSCPMTFPAESTGDQVLSIPVGLATVGDKLYIADAGARAVKVYKAGPKGTGKFLKAMGSPQTIDRIVDVAADARGSVYVLDYDRRCFHVFDPDGSYRLSVGRKGTGKGDFLRPTAIECDAVGNIYVLDAGRMNFQVFDSRLTCQGSANVEIAGAGEPLDIAVRPSDGNTYVLYGAPTPAIVVYGAHGRALESSLKKKDLFPHLPGDAAKIAVDSAGNICVAPKSRRRLYRYDAKGRPSGILTDVTSGIKSLTVSPSGAFFGISDTPPLVRVWDHGGWLLGGFVDPGDEKSGLRSIMRSAVSGDGTLLYSLAPDTYSILCSTVYGKPVKMMAGKVLGAGATPDKLNGPRDISTGPGSSASVLDAYGFRVVIYDPNQDTVPEIRFTRGVGIHQLVVPWRMAMDPVTGETYIYDQSPRLIKKYDARGGFMGAVGGPGTRDGQFVQVERMVIGARGELWVYDSGRGDIQRIDFRGKTARAGLTISRRELDSDIVDIGVDGRGRLLVLTGRDSVYVFTQR